MNLIIVIVVVGLAVLLVGGIYNQLVRRRNVEVGRTFHCNLFFTSEIKVFRYL
jgi:hypothetical protein